MSWSNRDSDWNNANSLFKQRLRGLRRRGILNCLFSSQNDGGYDVITKVTLVHARASRVLDFSLGNLVFLVLFVLESKVGYFNEV